MNKTITIANAQKQICIKALQANYDLLKPYNNNIPISWVTNDILALIGIMSDKYKLQVTLSDKEYDSFAHNHGVDFPFYIEDKSINHNKLVIIPCKDYDRKIFLNLDIYGNIIGLNFHQGLDDTTATDFSFSTPCPHLTEILDRLAHRRKQSLHYLDNADRVELMQLINDAIQKYADAFIF